MKMKKKWNVSFYDLIIFSDGILSCLEFEFFNQKFTSKTNREIYFAFLTLVQIFQKRYTNIF